jgi:hypothetical protein
LNAIVKYAGTTIVFFGSRNIFSGKIQENGSIRIENNINFKLEVMEQRRLQKSIKQKCVDHGNIREETRVFTQRNKTEMQAIFMKVLRNVERKRDGTEPI